MGAALMQLLNGGGGGHSLGLQGVIILEIQSDDYVILVSAQVLLVLTLGLWILDFGLGLDNFVKPESYIKSESWFQVN